MLSKKWQLPNGEHLKIDELECLLKDKKYKIFVGTDSHMIGGVWLFSTIIAFYEEGHGGTYVYTKEYIKKNAYHDLYSRLADETLRSIEIASSIYENYGKKPEIHLDLNTFGFKSAKYVKSLSLLVSSSGFDYQVKPNAWASSAIADKIAR